MRIETLARICHQINKAYCESIGDNSQHDWESAPEWQKESAVKGVRFQLANPSADASDSHASWLAEKTQDGWKYGPVKDASKKEHPCFVPYEELPKEQQVKDHLFKALCWELSQFVAE
jgi:hypothetical protein